MNHTKCVQEVYSKNKTLKREMRESINKCRHKQYSWVKRHNIIKMTNTTQIDLQIHVIKTKI